MIIPGTNGYEFDDSKFGYKPGNTPFGTKEETTFEGINQRFRVFVAGYDVTPDVSGVSVTQTMEGELTCTFTLENNRNKYVITKEDLEINIPKIVKESSIRTSQSANFNAGAGKNAVTLNDSVNLHTDSADGVISSDGVDISVNDGLGNKRKVLNHEINNVYVKRSGGINPQLMMKHMLFMVKWLSNIEKGENECIFDYKEPVIVFFQGRLSPMWYFGFTGFIKDFDVGYDYGGSPNVRVTCMSRKYALKRSVEIQSAVAKNMNLEAKNIDLRVNKSASSALKDVFQAKTLKDIFTLMFLKLSSPKTIEGAYLNFPPVPINYIDYSWLVFMEDYLKQTPNIEKYIGDDDVGDSPATPPSKNTPELIQAKKDVDSYRVLYTQSKKIYESSLKKEQAAKTNVDELEKKPPNPSDPLDAASDTLLSLAKQGYGLAMKQTAIDRAAVVESERGLAAAEAAYLSEKEKEYRKSKYLSVSQYLTSAVNNLHFSISKMFYDASATKTSIVDGNNYSDKFKYYFNLDTKGFYSSYLSNYRIDPQLLSKGTRDLGSIADNSSSVGGTKSVSGKRKISDNFLNTNYSSTVSDNIYQVSIFTAKPYTTQNVSAILDSNVARLWETDFSFSNESEVTAIKGYDSDGKETKSYQFDWKSELSSGVTGIHPAVNEDFINTFHILPQLFRLAVDNDRMVEISEKEVSLDSSKIERTVSQGAGQFFPKDYASGITLSGWIAEKLQEVFNEVHDRVERSEGKLKLSLFKVVGHEGTQRDIFLETKPGSVNSTYETGQPITVITQLYDPSPYNASQQMKFTKKLANQVVDYYRNDPIFKSSKYKYGQQVVSMITDNIIKTDGRGFFEPAGLDPQDSKLIENYFSKDLSSINNGKVKGTKTDRSKVVAPLLRQHNVTPDWPVGGINLAKLDTKKPGDAKLRSIFENSKKLMIRNRRVVITVEFGNTVPASVKNPTKVNKIRNATRTPYEKLKEQVFGVPTDVDPNVDGINFHRPRFIVMLPPLYMSETSTQGLQFREFNIFNAAHVNLKQVIDELLKSIQFKYYETPIGDIILEPLNYDFSPWSQISSYGETYGKYSIDPESKVPKESFVEQPASDQVNEVKIIPPYIATYTQPRNLELITLPIVKPKINFRHPYYFNNMNEKTVTFKFKSEDILTSIAVRGLSAGTTGATSTALLNDMQRDEFSSDITKLKYSTTAPTGVDNRGNLQDTRPSAIYVADGFEETVRSIDVDFKIVSATLKIAANVKTLVNHVYKHESRNVVKVLQEEYGTKANIKDYSPTIDSFFKKVVWPILYPKLRAEQAEASKKQKKPAILQDWLKKYGKSTDGINFNTFRDGIYDLILSSGGFKREQFPVRKDKDNLKYIYEYPMFRLSDIDQRDGISVSSEKRVDYIKSLTKIFGYLSTLVEKPKAGKGKADIAALDAYNKSLDANRDKIVKSRDDKFTNEFIPTLMNSLYTQTEAGKKDLKELDALTGNNKNKKDESKSNSSGVWHSKDSGQVNSTSPKVATFQDFALARARGEYNPQADFVTLYGIKHKEAVIVPHLKTTIDCKLYAIALFNQMYNNAFNYSYSNIPLTPELLVNRTGYFELYNFIGLIGQITNTYTHGETPSTSLEVSYPRRNILQSHYSIIDYDFDKAPQSDFINAAEYQAGSTKIFDKIKEIRPFGSKYGLSNFSIFRKLGSLYELTKTSDGKVTASNYPDYQNLKTDRGKIEAKIAGLRQQFRYYYTKLNSASLEVDNASIRYVRASEELARMKYLASFAEQEENKKSLARMVDKETKLTAKAKEDLETSIVALRYLTTLIFGFVFPDSSTTVNTFRTEQPGSDIAIGSTESELSGFVKSVLSSYPNLPEPEGALALFYKDYNRERVRGSNLKFTKETAVNFQNEEVNKLSVKSTYSNNKYVDVAGVTQPLLVCLMESIEIQKGIEAYSKTFRTK